VTLGGSPIFWETKKQTKASRSSAKAKYRAMAMVTTELIWLKSLLASLGVFMKHPISLLCDNQAALHKAKNPIFHKRTKHIESTATSCEKGLSPGSSVLIMFYLNTSW